MKFPRTLFKTIAIFVLAGVMSACGGGTGTTFSQGPPPQPTGANYTTCIDNAGSSQWVPNWQSNLFQSNYEAAISALVNHVSQASYASKIGYIRVGLGRGGEILLPGDWNNSSSGVCYDGFVGKWNYTIGGTSASSSSWWAWGCQPRRANHSAKGEGKAGAGGPSICRRDYPTGSGGLLILQPGLKCGDAIGSLRGTHGPALAHRPDRVGPGGIGRETGDDMDMKLRHLIAQGCRIDFLGRERRLHQPAGAGDLLDQHAALGRGQIVQLAQSRPLRHKDQPGKARIVHQQHQR